MKKVLILLLIALLPLSAFAQRRAKSAPSEFDVTLNGNISSVGLEVDGVVAGKGPARLPLTIKLQQGTHRIKATANGYFDFEETINVTGNMTVNINMRPRTAQLTVTSDMTPIRLFIDNNSQGAKGASLNFPFTIDLPLGTHTVKGTSPGYHDFEQTINLQRDTTVNIVMRPRTAKLTVISNVTPVRLFIDDSAQGAKGASLTFPYTIDLPLGNHTIKGTSPGYFDFEQSLNLQRDTTVRINMQPRTAKVQVIIPAELSNKNQNNPLASIKITVDGKPAQANFETTPGRHLVRFESGGLAVEQYFTFEAGRSYSVEPSLSIRLK